eukprot:CAMPEP_0183726340 /NCGR_PEP_ID=MMETSP0737-20130205/23063_1 /TAXON_ID=385413 /ORGANISM="Thalassiosira miniscula, Strain CCMP1093" /LENGTH=115 /DNA_ID=CAMNT_0025957657 /DNA_START=320 /DNA_END=667 /DNA_ORIENTATION=+
MTMAESHRSPIFVTFATDPRYTTRQGIGRAILYGTERGKVFATRMDVLSTITAVLFYMSHWGVRGRSTTWEYVLARASPLPFPCVLMERIVVSRDNKHDMGGGNRTVQTMAYQST